MRGVGLGVEEGEGRGRRTEKGGEGKRRKGRGVCLLVRTVVMEVLKAYGDGIGGTAMYAVARF